MPPASGSVCDTFPGIITIHFQMGNPTFIPALFDTTYGTTSSPEGLARDLGADHSWEGQEGTCAHTAGAGVGGNEG